jgi:catechol 2,3-dioxygenase-like lactoylglutathione lyase family enzyme
MQLAKNVIDLGLSTNNLEPMLRFWQRDAGLRFDHVLPVRRGQKQYRHDALGSVIKLNHHAEPLPAAAPSGYRELIIAREGVEKPRSMVDPDGNRVRLVPPGHDGITQLAITMGVRSLSEHRRFYGDLLGFAEQRWSGGLAFRLGDSLLLLEKDRAATVDPVRQALGWRYITLQIADIDTVHNDLRSKGVREGLAPVTLGSVARISMILDPDGNWIELSRPFLYPFATLHAAGHEGSGSGNRAALGSHRAYEQPGGRAGYAAQAVHRPDHRRVGDRHRRDTGGRSQAASG